MVGFVPKIGRNQNDDQHEAACNGTPNIPVRCMGEVWFTLEHPGGCFARAIRIASMGSGRTRTDDILQ